MVEMLGVLAIVGVLSIVGLYGYTKAMGRHHANELLNEAMKRAALVAGNLLNGDGSNLPQFDETPIAGGKFKKNVSTPADGKFAVEIDGVNDDLCNLVKELAGPIVQNIEPDTCSGDNNNMVLTYNNDLSTNSSGENPGGNTGGNDNENDENQEADPLCEGINCDFCAKCSGGTCVVDTTKEGKSCTTTDSEAGTCQSGTCVEISCPEFASNTAESGYMGASFTIAKGTGTITCYCPTGKIYDGTNCDSNCSSTVGDPCDDNSTVCLGYYCSIGPGTHTKDSKTGISSCGDAIFTPGPGTVASLGTPTSPKAGYLSSPVLYYTTWDVAVNYCDALKKAIDAGISGYSNLSLTHGRLASIPTGCSFGNNCPAFPNADSTAYWLNQLIQPDCNNYSNYSTTYGNNSCEALSVYEGRITSFGRAASYPYPLCE